MGVALILISFLSLLIISGSSSTRSEHELKLLYEGWLVEHHKNYNDLFEKEKRFDIFKDNLKYIDEHNAGNHTYQLGLNVFADLTVDEYRNTYLGFKPLSKMNMSNKVSNRYMLNKGEEMMLPSSIDWRELGAVTNVKNQGRCNSCWAFSAVATIESLNQIVRGDLVSLSEQELVDCYKKSCGPDTTVNAYKFIIQNHGIDTEADYPYKGVNGQCDIDKENKNIVSIHGYNVGPNNNENGMKKAVANQPISVAVDSSARDFQLYKSGIYTGSCGENVDHGVVVVGYGTAENNDFWLVKNSWGSSWGDQGYIRIERNINSRSGKCGIAKYISYPVIRSYPLKQSNVNQLEENHIEAEVITAVE